MGIDLPYRLCQERTSSCLSELEKGQHAQQHANVKADEHADAQQE
jgi:hypothetical protein